MPQLLPHTYLSVSYLVSSKRFLFKNMAHDGPFQHCTWLYLTVPGCTWLYLALPWSAMIYLSTDCHLLPLTGLNAFVYTGLNAQKLQVDGLDGMEISVNISSMSTRKSTKYKVQTILFKLINCVGILRNGGANPSMNVRFCEVPATILYKV